MIRIVYVVVLLLLLTAFVRPVLAQTEDPQLSMYMYNPLYYNPAAAGSEGVSRLQVTQRTQYLGYQTIGNNDDGGAQNTQLVSFTVPLAKLKGGVGIYAFNDRIGPISNQSVQASYAYRVSLKNGTLALGVQAGLYNKTYDYSQLRANDPGDPLIPSGKISQAKPDVGVGVYYNTTDYWIGVSVKHLNQATYTLGTDRSVNPLSRNAYLTAGYRLGLGEFLDVQPSILVQYSTFGGTKYSNIAANVVATYDNRIWFGGGYRFQDAIMLTAGLNLGRNNAIRLGAGADFTVGGKIGGVNPKSGVSYEILVGYALPAIDARKKPIIRTPRFRY